MIKINITLEDRNHAIFPIVTAIKTNKEDVMFFQRIFALFDKIISEIFRLQAWGTGDEKANNRWTYFVDVGQTVGVVGANGKIHTMMGYWSVHHYYDGKSLLRRIPVRKDLKEGERLATQEEIARHQIELRQKFARTSGGMMNY